MSRKIGFLQRWMFIIDKISSTPYISKRELEEALANEMDAFDGTLNIGTRPRTLERDISEIRTSTYMDISIEFCKRNNGYFIPVNEKSLSKLDRLFELSSLMSFKSLKGIVYADTRLSRGLEHRFALIGAIRRQLEVEVHYHKYSESDSPTTLRHLRPYALREFKHRWYLLAVEAGKPNAPLKTWGLDRIGVLTRTNRHFEKDPSVDVERKFEHCFGIYGGEGLEPVEVVLSFTPLSGMYHNSLPLHKSQRTLVHNEQEFRIALKVKLTLDFMLELLSNSVGMRVIAPDSLRQQLKDMHQQAIDNN